MGLFRELQRRNVYRVAIAYAVTAWLLAQVSDLALGAFGAPPWVQKTILFLLALGFPVACLLAWAYELTPDGIKRSKDVGAVEDAPVPRHQPLDLLIIVVLVVAVVVLVFDRFDRAGETVEVVQETVRPSVAILPFVNRSAVEQDAFFVDGVHEDLLRQIAGIGSIKTISRTSVVQYRDSAKSAPEIARELGVDTVLEGGVQRAGKQVRINVQLIDATTDEYLWSESFDRELSAENIFAIQSEIAAAVARSLEATLTPRERTGLRKIPTDNLEALEAYFEGRRLMETRNSTKLLTAAQLFETAINLDPEFALAYVALADTYRLQSNYGGLPRDIADTKGQQAVEKALQLDDQLGEAYASLANLRRRSGDHTGAEQAFLRGIELSPNYAPLYQWYGEYLTWQDPQPDKAVRYGQMAVALDPQSPIIRGDYAETLTGAGRFDESLAQYQKSVEFDPEFAVGYSGIGREYRYSFGRLADAAAAFRKAVELNPEYPWPYMELAKIHLDLGNLDQAADWLDELQEVSPGHRARDYGLLNLHQHLEKPDDARIAAQEILEALPYHLEALRFLRDDDLSRGDAESARSRYIAAYPELNQGESPRVNKGNLEAAVDFACVLFATNEDDLAGKLLTSSLQFAAEAPRVGFFGYEIADAKAYAMLGERDQAIHRLRTAVDAGWRTDWRLHLEFDSCLGHLHDDPGYRAEIERIRQDMRAQREQFER
jgi:TolB-like protein/thioredoxin-like negative regulator of GroEL